MGKHKCLSYGRGKDVDCSALLLLPLLSGSESSSNHAKLPFLKLSLVLVTLEAIKQQLGASGI